MKIAYLSSGTQNIKVAPKYFESVFTLVYKPLFVNDRCKRDNGAEV